MINHLAPKHYHILHMSHAWSISQHRPTILHTFKSHWISMGSAWIGMLPAIWDGMMFSGMLPKVMISNLDCIQEIMSWFIMHKVFIPTTPTTTCSRESSVLSPCVGAGQSHCRTWQCQMLEDRQTFLQFPGDANIVVETKQITMSS